jgi:5-methylcytosine-specific restriction endonuclease McrA
VVGEMSNAIFKKKPIRLKGERLRRLQQSVLERDNYSCQGGSCPGGFPIDKPHHIKFKSQGGEDTMENLITLCRHCHGQKHGINYV